jgi:hypothetical protein
VKRGREVCVDLVPLDRRRPNLSAACIGRMLEGLADGSLVKAEVRGSQEGGMLTPRPPSVTPSPYFTQKHVV